MACSGSHCTNHGTGTTTCVGHRSSCSTNRPLVQSGDFAVPGQRIRGTDVEDLRAKIRAELTAYNVHYLYNFTKLQPGTIAATQPIDNTTVNELYEMTRDVDGGSVITRADGDVIDDGFWDTIRTKYNVVRQDCICNTDCACNNVCSCHNDCGCNYSDRRLKKEIVYC